MSQTNKVLFVIIAKEKKDVSFMECNMCCDDQKDKNEYPYLIVPIMLILTILMIELIKKCFFKKIFHL